MKKHFKFRLLSKDHIGIEDCFCNPRFCLENCAKGFGHDAGGAVFYCNMDDEDKKDCPENTDVICYHDYDDKEYYLSYSEYLFYLLETKKIAEKNGKCSKGEFDSNIEEFQKITGVTKPAKRNFWSIFKR